MPGCPQTYCRPFASRLRANLRNRFGIAMLLMVSATPHIVEAHVVFAPPKTYAKAGLAPTLDLSPQRASYVALGTQSYRRASEAAASFQRSVELFLAEPSQVSLDAARTAWIDARKSYLQTEIFRFNDGPIDAPATADRPEGPESHINAWPVDESTIDAVIGNKRAGLVQRTDFELSAESIRAADQQQDESAITTGWHAIEFLLWGQDLSKDGPGNRPYQDYLPGQTIRERRRQYLRIVTSMLVEDLARVSETWSDTASGSFRAQLLATPPIEVLGRSLHGTTSYVAIELFGERFAVALDSRSQEDEHSCFSDTSLLDLQSGLQGVRNYLTASYDGQRLGASLLELVEYQDPALGKRLRIHLEAAERHLANLDVRFDQLILTPDGHPDRVAAEKALDELRALALALKAASQTLGVNIVVPGI